MTVEGYRSGGGIRGAVARSADRLYDGLTAEERATLRAVLLRLVTPSLEGDPVRCRVASRSLLGDPGRERVVGLLVRARLVTSEADSFEIAHEALARAWPRLRSWLDDDVAGQRILRHLGAAADGWDTLGRPDTELYGGARLDTAIEWREQSSPRLTVLEQAFLDTSEDHDRSQRRALETRTMQEARTNRRLRRLLVFSAVVVVAAIIAGLVAVRQAGRADTEGQRSGVRELAARATADVDIDPERSALLALAALERAGAEDGPLRRDIEQALHDSVTELRLERRLVGADRAVDWTSDGRGVLIVGRGNGDVELRDVATGRTTLAVPVNANEAIDSPDGSLIATTGHDGLLRLLDAVTGEERKLVTGDGVAQHPSFSPDGTLLAAAWPGDDGGLVRVIDVRTGRLVEEISWPGAHALSFSPDGTRLAVIASSAGAVLDVADGRQIFVLEAGLGSLTDVAWSPDGRLIAIGRDSGAAQVHEAATGEQRTVLPGHKSWVGAVAWSPDSALLATASSDGTTRVWALFEGGGRQIMTLSADDTRTGFGDVAFSPDGTRLATGTFGGTAIIWRTSLEATAEVAILPAAAFTQGAAQFTPDGKELLATSGDGNIAVWNVATWQQERTLGTDTSADGTTVFGIPLASSSDPVGLAPSPDGELVAAISDDQYFGINPVLPVYDVDGGTDGFHVDLGGWVSYMHWTSDGKLLALAGGNRDGVGVIITVDRQGRTVSTLEFPDRFVESARFTNDDAHLVVVHSTPGPYVPGTGRVEVWDWRHDELVNALDADAWSAVPHPTEPLVAIGPRDEAADQTVGIWNFETGRRVAALDGHSGTVNGLAFTNDGSRLATANGDGSIRVWDTHTGQQQLELRGHAGLVASVSFSPDGRWLASYGAEGTVRVWALDLDELAEIARQRVTRNLTDAECNRYLRRTSCGGG